MTLAAPIAISMGMSDHSDLELEQIGRAIAQQVAGAENVEQVEATEAYDWTYKPAYYFAFLIDQAPKEECGPSLAARLSFKLQDVLSARGDEHMAFVRVLNRRDWDKRGPGWLH